MRTSVNKSPQMQPSVPPLFRLLSGLKTCHRLRGSFPRITLGQLGWVLVAVVVMGADRVAEAQPPIVAPDLGTAPEVEAPTLSADGRDAAVAAVEGEAGDLSDWAHAGVMWTQAHYLRKLTRAAMSQNPSAEQRAQLAKTEASCDALIAKLERFGWNRVNLRRPATSSNAAAAPATTRPRDPATRSSDASTTTADPRDPAAVGNALANELNLPKSPAVDSDPKGPIVTPAEAAQRDRIAMRRKARESGDRDSVFDTENPAGVDDPGVDDELNEDLETFDVQQYRVDDVVDSTMRERTNIADAIEDGAEMALAAGVDNVKRGMSGRISIREVQTNTTTLPYSVDSIYDSDDYDPDADYSVDNPMGNRIDDTSGYAAVADGSDGRDDIDNEDELAEAYLGADRTNAPRTNRIEALSTDVASPNELRMRSIARQTPQGTRNGMVDPPAGRVAVATDANRVTARRVRLSQSIDRDSDWVNFTLQQYQARWDRLTADGTPPSLPALLTHLQMTRFEMATTAETIKNLASSQSLRQIANDLSSMQ